MCSTEWLLWKKWKYSRKMSESRFGNFNLWLYRFGIPSWTFFWGRFWHFLRKTIWQNSFYYLKRVFICLVNQMLIVLIRFLPRKGNSRNRSIHRKLFLERSVLKISSQRTFNDVLKLYPATFLRSSSLTEVFLWLC